MARLVNFQSPDLGPELCEEGLEALGECAAPLHVVVVVGDGRAGKSYLANDLIGDEVFRVGDSMSPVTEGMEIHIGRPSWSSAPVAFVDCEGGNNALATSRTVVNVLGGAVATVLVFVTSNALTEAALETLGRTVAEMQFRGQRVPPKLVMVVNRTGLACHEDALEEALSLTTSSGGSELRSELSRVFPPGRRTFIGIPDKQARPDEFRAARSRLAAAVAHDPLAVAGLNFDGKDATCLLEECVKTLQGGPVELPSVHRLVLDRHLTKITDELVKHYLSGLPKPETFVKDLASLNQQRKVLQQFDERTQQVDAPEAVGEARRRMQLELESAWSFVDQRNTDLGRQPKETRAEWKPEVRTRNKTEQRRWFRIRSETETVSKVFTRTITTLQDGTVDESPWVESTDSITTTSRTVRLRNAVRVAAMTGAGGIGAFVTGGASVLFHATALAAAMMGSGGFSLFSGLTWQGTRPASQRISRRACEQHDCTGLGSPRTCSPYTTRVRGRWGFRANTT
jgi:hypothetical protein